MTPVSLFTDHCTSVSPRLARLGLSILMVGIASVSLAASGKTMQKTMDADYPVAGLNPSKRPVGAPVLASAPEISSIALSGLALPVPATITTWLQDQGAWYSPFTHPGIPGRYDLRQWHHELQAPAQP